MNEQGLLRRLMVRTPAAIFVPLILIAFIGILNLSSAARMTRPDLYLSQMSKFGMGFFLMMITAVIHTRMIRRLAYVVFSFSLVLLALVLVIGVSAKGCQRWLLIGGVRFQPSDPAKIALVMALAHYCSSYWPAKGYNLLTLIRPLNFTRPVGFLLAIISLLVKERHDSEFLSLKLASPLGMSIMVGLLVIGFVWLILAWLHLNANGFHMETVIAPIDIALVPFLLIYLEPDLGTGLIILAIAGIMFLFVGINWLSLVIGGVSFGAIGFLAYLTVLKDYQKQRLISFFSSENDSLGEGYQAMQSIIAIGSGRITGKGYNGGTQTQLSFLPENATDFVFGVWAEEWGFFASVILLFLYFVLIWGILRVATRVTDHFSQLICVGVAANLIVHVVINVGMVTGMLPVVGVPLILMSYGGTASIITLISIGLVINVALWRGAK